jgi:hypothetical protein
MNRTSHILILVIIWLFCSSRTCTEDRNLSAIDEVNALAAAKDSIRQTFEVDQPDEDLLRAYEKTARQKLSDFADFLKIVSDTSLNIKFREQAAEMVKRLFENGDADIRNWAKVYSETEISTLKELLSKSLSNGSAFWIQPEQIDVSEPLSATNDSTYRGKLSFYQKCIPFDFRKPTPQILQMKSINIHVIKKIKSFGDESLNVWEVYLGNFN